MVVNAGKIEYSKSFIKKEVVWLLKEELGVASGLIDEKTGVLNFTCVALLKEGQMFGEKGLDDGVPRAATCVCAVDCDFACLLKKDYDDVLREIHRTTNERIKSFFVQQVFKDVNQTLASKLGFDIAKIKVKFKKGDKIFQQGAVDNNIYIVKKGLLSLDRTERRLTKQQELDLEAPKIVMAQYQVSLIGPSEIIGEECLFVDKPKVFSATVFSDECTLYRTSKETFRSYMIMDVELSDSLRNMFDKKQKLRVEVLDRMTRREELSHALGRKDHVGKKPVNEMATPSKALFTEKYSDEYVQFMRGQGRGRSPRVVYLGDVQDSLYDTIYSQKDKVEIDAITNQDYLLEDRSYQELHKQYRDIKYHKQNQVTKKFTEYCRMTLTKPKSLQLNRSVTKYSDIGQESVGNQLSTRRNPNPPKHLQLGPRSLALTERTHSMFECLNVAQANGQKKKLANSSFTAKKKEPNFKLNIGGSKVRRSSEIRYVQDESCMMRITSGPDQPSHYYRVSSSRQSSVRPADSFDIANFRFSSTVRDMLARQEYAKTRDYIQQESPLNQH
jgi:CRP-like cAMP-binding protein